jgi:hypothetical protein
LLEYYKPSRNMSGTHGYYFQILRSCLSKNWMQCCGC